MSTCAFLIAGLLLQERGQGRVQQLTDRKKKLEAETEYSRRADEVERCFLANMGGGVVKFDGVVICFFELVNNWHARSQALHALNELDSQERIPARIVEQIADFSVPQTETKSRQRCRSCHKCKCSSAQNEVLSWSRVWTSMFPRL